MSSAAAGPLSAALFLLALTAFLMGALDPFFRPLAVASIAAGAVVAPLLWVKYQRASHPTISEVDPVFWIRGLGGIGGLLFHEGSRSHGEADATES